MARKNLIYYILPLISLFIFSCDEDDFVAEELLYGGGKVTDTEVEINVTLTRINGWYMLDGTQIYGLDVTIGNQNNDDIYSVSIKVNDVYPATNIIGVSEDTNLIIDYIPANSSLKPDYHWYADDIAGTIYIGNMYVLLYNFVSGGVTYSIDFEVNFNIPGKGDYQFYQTRTFTTISNLSDLPV